MDASHDPHQPIYPRGARPGDGGYWGGAGVAIAAQVVELKEPHDSNRAGIGREDL